MAVDLYIAGGLIEKARASLTEYRDAIRRQNNTRGTLEEELALSDAVVAKALEYGLGAGGIGIAVAVDGMFCPVAGS